METRLDQRRGNRIPALDLDILQTEPYETERSSGGTYRSKAVERLLLSDGQEWFGCLRCSVVAPKAEQVIAHMKAHPVAVAQRRRQATRVTEEFRRTTVEREEEEVREETCGVDVGGGPCGGAPNGQCSDHPRPAGRFTLPSGSRVTAARRRPVPAPPSSATPPTAADGTHRIAAVQPDPVPPVEHRDLEVIAVELRDARLLVVALEGELAAAVRADWRT